MPTNFHLIIIKIKPIINAKVPPTCLAKNIKVSWGPADTQIPQKNNKFANIKNARSKRNKIPMPYKNAEIDTIISPRPRKNIYNFHYIDYFIWIYSYCHLNLMHS